MTTFTNISQASFVGVYPIFADKLKVFIERAKISEDEVSCLSSEIKDFHSEEEGTSFDTGTLHKIISLRRKDHLKRPEEEANLELYMQAMGKV